MITKKKPHFFPMRCGVPPPSNTPKMSKFLPVDEALAVAQSLNLANRFEWRAWCKEGMRPPNVPSNPQRTHKE